MFLMNCIYSKSDSDQHELRLHKCIFRFHLIVLPLNPNQLLGSISLLIQLKLLCL